MGQTEIGGDIELKRFTPDKSPPGKKMVSMLGAWLLDDDGLGSGTCLLGLFIQLTHKSQ